MSDQSTNPPDADDFEGNLGQAIINILETTNSPAIQRAREVIAHRLAIAGDVAPSRIPAPRNITEIGGYINLLSEYGETEQRARMISAALGIAGPQVSLPQPGALPPLAFVTRPGARPAGPQMATFPLSFTIRSDFSPAFDNALEQITNLGGAVPILTTAGILPPGELNSLTDGLSQLGLIGRALRLSPTAALHAVADDPLSLTRPTAGGAFEVFARVLDPAAPLANTIADDDFTSWECDTNQCNEIDTTDARFAITGILNAAGWHQADAPSDPVTLGQPGNWMDWTNVTGLVPGVTRYADELQLLYSANLLVGSAIVEQLDFIWDGSAFTAA